MAEFSRHLLFLKRSNHRVETHPIILGIGCKPHRLRNLRHATLQPTPEQSAAMEADSRAVQAAERAERRERRAERREEMMDEADAINRAYGNRKVYILH